MIPTLQEIESLARQAGEILREGYIERPGFGRNHQVDHKGTIDLVTETDHRSEAFLIREIQARYPDHRIIAEESGIVAGQDACAWYIDPLDGTVNFAHGVPIFAVSIGFAQGGVLQLGVVYDPTRDECFSAARRQGAFLNGRPIRVSQAPLLDQSLLVTGFPYDIRTNPTNNLDNYARFALASQGVRRLGSAALDLCYIASGRFDGYWEIRLSPWDVAAGALIAEEAGARVTSVQGDPDILAEPITIAAANPALHAQILQVLAEVRAEPH